MARFYKIKKRKIGKVRITRQKKQKWPEIITARKSAGTTSRPARAKLSIPKPKIKPRAKTIAKPTVRLYTLRRRRITNKRYAVLGVIFIFGLILLILLIRLIGAALFSVRINIKDVEAMRISPKEISLIYEICAEESRDFNMALTAYCVNNGFFKEKQIPRTKEQLKMDFFPNIERIKKKLSEKRFNELMEVIETQTFEMKAFPIPKEYASEQYMFGDTWNAKSGLCSENPHKGCDIADRENDPGRIPVLSVATGIIESKSTEKGSHTLTIKTERGSLYKYKSLHSVNEGLEAGSSVTAGSIIGYMGNGSKPDSEKTERKHQTGVHISVQFNLPIKKDLQINPYPYLRHLEYLRDKVVS